MKYNSLKHNTFIPFQQYPFYPNPPHQMFRRPTKPKNFISNFKCRALLHFLFLSPSKIWICSSFPLSLTLSLSNSPWICSRSSDSPLNQ
ncbi:hypothetical protein Hanom_Chr11g01034761 [Helianthus anomalus]